MPSSEVVPNATPRRWRRTPLRGGTWNLRVGRDRHDVAHEVYRLMVALQLHFLVVQEAARYIDTLTALDGFRVITFRGRGGSARDSAVIVRRGSGRVRRRALHVLEAVGWERRAGLPGLHWHRSAVSVRLGWLRVLSVHLPPGPFSLRLRRQAHLTALRTITRIGERWRARGAWVMAGDWNRRRDDPRVVDLAEQLDAHTRGSGIDWLMFAGCRVSNVQTLDFGGSDHHPKTFTVHPPKRRIPRVGRRVEET